MAGYQPPVSYPACEIAAPPPPAPVAEWIRQPARSAVVDTGIVTAFPMGAVDGACAVIAPVEHALNASRTRVTQRRTGRSPIGSVRGNLAARAVQGQPERLPRSYHGAMRSVRRTVIVVILVIVSGLTSLLGLPFMVPIINAVGRRKGQESAQILEANA